MKGGLGFDLPRLSSPFRADVLVSCFSRNRTRARGDSGTRNARRRSGKRSASIPTFQYSTCECVCSQATSTLCICITESRKGEHFEGSSAQAPRCSRCGFILVWGSTRSFESGRADTQLALRSAGESNSPHESERERERAGG